MLAKLVSIFGPRDLPALASQSAGITGLSHRARPLALDLLAEDLNLQDSISWFHTWTLCPLKEHRMKLGELPIKETEGLH